jgi:fumarate reductase subunit C
VYLLLLVRALSKGNADYQHFLGWSASPVALLLNLVSLVFISFHAITWFNLAPQAMVVHLRGERIPAKWITGVNYAAWALVSALAAWILLGG